MKQKIIVVRGKNNVEELTHDIERTLEALEPGWEIVSASTTLEPWDKLVDATGMRHALHVYMVTTVVVRWPQEE